ncbi:MAG: hypothetical protein A3G18_04045 [Rhodospirillales bacterium RIFCSPLOWO2_12_FULL_58_28]|nr:MAG: hypothetical protein A3H92_04925 [Rhodospirillales bacterium RIFCSPLOWO2_02_FULL_58_16]OHC78694.1 MAG: hypothetical protein A3G18_04045 [Rhodospirillales bacterium RIFCSPLOWO2_12_FULL_58_28]
MIYRRLSAVVFSASAFFVAFVILGVPAQAKVVDVFEVKGVAVDATADAAAAARDQAVAEGEVAAFKRLLERLVIRSDYRRLPDFTREKVDSYLKDFSVAEEKTSQVRYLAKLDFRFKGDEVRRLLIDFAVSFAETPSKPVLVLPVFETAGTRLLFDDPNPWRDAWAARSLRDSLVPTLLPTGDLRDIAAIGGEQALAGDRQRLNAVAARYGAGDTLVAHAIQRMDERGRPALEVFVTRYGAVTEAKTVTELFPSVDGESFSGLMARAALELTLRVEDNWKLDNRLHFGQRGVVAAIVRIGGLKDWLAVRQRLDGVAVINSVDLVLLSRDEARINIHYIGEPEQLALALEQKDIALLREGDEWILSLAR